MPSAAPPPSLPDQQLLNAVKAAHQTLLLARRTKTTEIDRRLTEARIQAARDWDETEARIRVEMDYEIAAHEAVEDQALIAAVNANIPVTQIAVIGFGNRVPGAVQAKLRELRSVGMVGNPEGYQLRDPDASERTVKFPEAVDVSGVLSEATTVGEPTYTLLPVALELIPGEPEYDVQQVRLDMDPRDPYFKQISKNARPGTPNQYATFATLYVHPGTNLLTVLESNETGDVYWDHPVARWVKDHPREAAQGFSNAIDA